MKNLKTLIAALVVTTGFIFSSCDDNDSDEMNGTGSVRVEATDAAVDAENISGVYLSVEEVQIIANGTVKNSITFEEPETFDLMAYQNGETKLLGEADVDAGSYDEVRLILSSTTQAWVEFTDNTTQEIEVPSGSTSGYKIMGDFEVLANGVSEVVLDVDLRKALVKRGNGEFNLRPTARLISKAEAGSIQGNVDMSDYADADKVVVYAYVQGTYNESETSEPAEGSSRFEGSINSAVASTTGNFTLAFMPEGEYELIIAEYKEETLSDEVSFEAAAKVEVEISGEVMSIFSVQARSVTNLLIDIF